eukprot:2750666-Pyramimonas_sp.AAC.1
MGTRSDAQGKFGEAKTPTGAQHRLLTANQGVQYSTGRKGGAWFASGVRRGERCVEVAIETGRPVAKPRAKEGIGGGRRDGDAALVTHLLRCAGPTRCSALRGFSRICKPPRRARQPRGRKMAL